MQAINFHTYDIHRWWLGLRWQVRGTSLVVQSLCEVMMSPVGSVWR